ncbi:hypothetical protein CHLNCDRAFT_57908 [Chlorella variabilis]|uniref:Cyclin-like domain-containing protein n=1 Tax=Chlorella variabilis TaxID=554065 RepID=E1ZGA5_CHLVA|nr:hypothetical protein CHLNCDRAFT_57908 [Chlorella variabilis]EFN55262.1 hypothetical protein CHLNCDRAFT_57908 [Chlorella variabilis]|eukprot:XP_005847364.1 hypothetical protein CHLNCDRAFT_57908 [Chlorella variabilis]
MVYCNYCACEVDVEVDDANGFSCCVQCGRVLEDTAFSADITFQKDAGGESTVVGQFVNESGVARGIGRIHGGRVYAYQADSHEKAQQRGRHEIAHLVDQLSVRPREESIEAAHRLYKLALQRGFTRGRRTNQVAAACVYLVCRQDSKPFLLIDFSDALQINVFTLGAVFLQLAKLLRLTEHPMFAKPVDPSLYIHRFADRLDFGRQMHAVANTALRLVASMKRDWIQTGRRPSGICGAAIYIAAHIHGFERSVRDVVAVVHIGEHTLSKRLYEFSSTSASAYTADEFEERVKQIEADETERLEAAQPVEPVGLLESTGCEHLREWRPAAGVCDSSGGVYNGANPPAFDRNRRKEMAELLALPEPEEEEVDEYDQEEQGIAEAMVTAFHDSELQQFAQFLPSSAEEAAVAEESEAAGARRHLRSNGLGSMDATAGSRRKRKGAASSAGIVEAAGLGQEEQQPQAQAQAAAVPSAATSSQGAAMQGQPHSQAEPLPLQQQTDKRQRGGALVPCQPSAQAGAAAAAAATAGAAGGSSRHSQHSDQTAAAGGEEVEGEAGIATVGAGAIVPVLQPEPPEEEGGDDLLSDIGDSDIDMYLADDAEVKCKEEIWNMMNRDWLEKQAAKRAAQEAAERAVAEQQAAQEAAEAAGVAYKRGRGRPVGSKTKNHHRGAGMADLPPAETAQEAAMRMLDHRKLSNKINYSALADLFAEDGGAGGDGDVGEPPALAPEALEGDEDDKGRGRAVTAAMRARKQQQQEEEARREAQQQAALEAETRSMGRRSTKGDKTGAARLASLGLPAASSSKLGGASGSSSGPLSPRSGVGALARRSGLGSLRDSNFRSQMTSKGADGGSGSGKKSVRFAD